MDGDLDTVRAYYRTLDTHSYDELANLLDPGFTHYRPDRTLEGRGRFVRFMREERPMTDTTHEIETIYRAVEDAEDESDNNDNDDDNGDGVVVRGRLLGSDGEALFEFADAHELFDGEIIATYTYTR